MTARIPPHNLDAEESVLGSLLLSRDANEAIDVSGLIAEHFYKPSHQIAYEAIRALRARGEPVDSVTVAEELRHTGLLEYIGGQTALYDLQVATPGVSNAGHYAEIVMRAARLRRIIALAADVADSAFDESCDVDDVLARLTKSVDAMIDGGDVAGASYEPVDLSRFLDADPEIITPTILARSDGRSLFYPGRVNGAHGDPGAHKSWVGGMAVAEVLRAGGAAMIIDYEDAEDSTFERLVSLGVQPQQLVSKLAYVHPDEAYTDIAAARLLRHVRRLQPVVVVVDSCGEAFGLDGLDEDRDVEVAGWFRRFPRRIADEGSGVINLDHATKARENPLFPSGSKRKRAAVTGASYLVECLRPLVRGGSGVVKLTCAKDRHGAWRQGETVAMISLDQYPDGGTIVHVDPPPQLGAADGPEDRIMALIPKVVVAVETRPGLNQGTIVPLIGGRAAEVRAALDLAAQAGHIRLTTGERGAKLYFPTNGST